MVQPDHSRRFSAATRWAITWCASATTSIATRPVLSAGAAVTLTGTLGAFIRVESRIPDKIALFDIGIAGPIAGFVVAVPALFVGLTMSRVDRLPRGSRRSRSARRAAALSVRARG